MKYKRVNVIVTEYILLCAVTCSIFSGQHFMWKKSTSGTI